MAISEMKKNIVINNYFQKECTVNTSIKEAYRKGFERGLTKAPKEDAIPVAWIQERIKNANEAGFTLIAHQWQELIDGYHREADHE